MARKPKLAVAVGRRLREAMKAAGTTPVEVARQLGCNRVAVHNWLSGAYTPSAAHLSRLALLLGVSVDALLGLTPSGRADLLQAHAEARYWAQTVLRAAKTLGPDVQKRARKLLAERPDR